MTTEGAATPAGFGAREFVGIRFDPRTFAEMGVLLRDRPADAPFAYVVTPNVDHVVRLDREAGLRPLYDAAWLRLCDSRILAHLARGHGIDLPVVTGSDLTAHVLRDLMRPGDRIAVVGGGQDTAARLGALLPGVEVVQHRPPFGLRHDPPAIERAARFVAGARARFTFLAVGSPQQEMLAFELSRVPATGIGLCVGSSIDFLTGERRRAPSWMRRAGLEWTWRLMSEPRRMWRRYLVEGPRILRIVDAWAKRRKAGRSATSDTAPDRKIVLAIASAGGHWKQLMLLAPAWSHHDVRYATTLPGLAEESGVGPATLIPDCNRDAKLEIMRSGLALVRLLVRLRPHVVVTTGALPGLLALIVARRLGARTIWVDSVANAEDMSLAGRNARKHADLWMSQWPAVAEAMGADYAGSVL